MAEKTLTREEILQDLEIRLKQANLNTALAAAEDAEEALMERKNKRENLRKQQKDRAYQLADEERQRKTRIQQCPHKKGGMDLAGYREGTDEQFAVFRHQFPNGDYMIQCQRCSNVVLPPVEPIRVADLAEAEPYERYGFSPAAAGFYLKNDPKYKAARITFNTAIRQYNKWLRMPTLNVASTSGQVQQVTGAADFKRVYRLAMHESHNIPPHQAMRWPIDLRKQTEEEEEDAA
jgi:hypothetical protein